MRIREFFLFSTKCNNIKALFELTTSMEVMKDLHNVVFQHIPTSLEEYHRITVQAQYLVTGHCFHYLQHLSFLKFSLKPISLMTH